MFRKLLKGLGYFVLALFALAVIGSFMGKDKEGVASSSPAPSAPAPAPVEPALAVSVSQLFKDYEANEVAADQKYKGKRLAVSGTVQSIDKDAFDNIVVRLRTSNEFLGAMASLDDKHKQHAASLQKGQKVALTCVGGGLIIGAPVLRKCEP